MEHKQLRPYQSRIILEASTKNSIIVLPTGSGKTFVASEMVKNSLLRNRKKCVFLVPTIMLVSQQSKAILEWFSYFDNCKNFIVKEYHAGLANPFQNGNIARFDVLVSTPKAFLSAKENSPIERGVWDTFGVLVFDEVHHVLKDHPYRKIALDIQRQPVEETPQVIGLSASLTYAVTENKVKKQVEKLCSELRIMYMGTASKEELVNSNYFGLQIQAEVSLPIMEIQGVTDIQDRKPHLMHKSLFERLRDGKATDTTKVIHGAILFLEEEVRQLDSNFCSPLSKPSLKAWGEYASKQQDHHLKNKRPILHRYYKELEDFYEALRILATTWEEGNDLATLFLQMMRQEKGRTLPHFYQHHLLTKSEFPRLELLTQQLMEKYKTLKSFRGIVFVSQRITCHILLHHVQKHELLRDIFSPTILYSTRASGKKVTPSLSLSSSQGREALSGFASGTKNLLITTVVAEEGMDVPDANFVLRFDPMIHSVSYVQGRGRARHEHSEFVVLAERPDRPTASLAQVEQQQLDILQDFKPAEINRVVEDKSKLAAQSCRERGAVQQLKRKKNRNDSTFAIANLNEFVKKTKTARVETTFSVLTTNQCFMCKLVYSSPHSKVIKQVYGEGTGETKKIAKRVASFELLNRIEEAFQF